MTRKYSLMIEGTPGSYSAYVPELPTILVTGNTIDQLTARASEAIGLYWEEVGLTFSPTATVCEIEVDLPMLSVS